MMKIKIVCIVGPTASGKSDFAVQYAKEHNGEIISADSRQVYIGMDIGTGKITKEEMQGIPHHLLDVCDPKKQFNVEKFKILANRAIEDIHGRGKLPILCGGTGFYIDAVVNNISYPDVPCNTDLRKKLNEKSSVQLFKMLKKLDDQFADGLNNSERNNKQRLIRKIEIASTLGKVEKLTINQSGFDVTWIGLNFPFPKLKERIHKRLLKRLEMGMIKEVENLHKKGVSWKRMEELGLEYRYISRFLRKQTTKDEMIKQLEMEICHYAKRQMVWWKRNKEIKWIENN